jgi:hypothetical protein
VYGDVSLSQLRQKRLIQKKQSANPECNKKSNRCYHQPGCLLNPEEKSVISTFQPMHSGRFLRWKIAVA